jgi:beta-glucanase (GH16 family)
LLAIALLTPLALLQAQITNGSYTVTPQNATALRLDDEGARTTTGNGIDVYTANGTAAQNWAFSNTGVVPAGYYNIATLGAYCLTASGTASNSVVVLDPCAGASSQAWEAVASGSTFTFHPASNTGLCLDVRAAGTASGTVVDVYTCNGTAAQNWSGPTASGSGGGGGGGGGITSASIAAGTYTATPQNATALRLDDQAASTATGNPIDVYTSNGTSAQNWALSSSGVVPSGYYNLATEGAYCLTASGTASGSAAVLDPCAGSSAQAWAAVASGSNYTFHPANNTGNCLDVASAGTASGTKVQVYTCNGTNAQSWALGSTGSGGSGGGGGTGTGSCSGISDITVGGRSYTPTWCQEFTGAAGPPSTSAWTFDLGGGGWGNNEAEVYCGPPGYSGNPSQCPTSFSTATAPVYIDGNGHLVIQPRNVNGTWISGRMNTSGKQNFEYGILEASIQAPDVNPSGLWPAFWTLGSDIGNPPWPACGESDIMELWPSSNGGAGTTGNNSTIHTAVTGGSGMGAHYSFPNGEQNDNAFHTYGMIWSANTMSFFVDNPSSTFYTVTSGNLPSGDTWPFNANLFTILNVAVGGNLGGSTSGLNPGPMIVDYVRYYQ